MDVATQETPEAVRAAPIAGGTIATPDDDLNSSTISSPSVNQNNHEVIMPYNNAFDIENLKMNIESVAKKVQNIENNLSSTIIPPHDYKQLYIESLLSRIESLERCTQYQQEIIRLMQKNPSPHVASSSAPPSDTQAVIIPVATASSSENASASAPGQNISIDTTSKKKPLPVKKKAVIIGDSMLGGVRNWQRDGYSVKVNPFGGATSEDMVSMTDIALRRDPAILLIHVGTNDLKKKVDTKKHLQRVITNARSSNANINIGISAICHREDDKRLINKVKDINNQLKNFCSHHQVAFIDHDDFDHTCLSKGKLHPNSNGNKSLYMDFDRTIKSMV